MRTRLNVRLLIALIVALGAASALIHFAHDAQLGHTTRALIEQADGARAAHDPEREAILLRAYLGIRPEDGHASGRLGLALERRARTRDDRLAARSVLERVVRQDPSRQDARRALVRLEVADDIRAIDDARANLKLLMGESTNDAELEGLLARCFETENRPGEAVDWYRRAIEHDPSRVEDHARVANLSRIRLRDAAKADAVMDLLVRRNPGSFRAHLARASYRERFGLAGAETDLACAEVLAPDEPDVLLAAGSIAEPRRARERLERGIAMHPRDARFFLRRAEVERRDGHPAAVVDQLQRAIQRLPEHHEILLALADAEIEAGQLDAAEKTIAGLRTQSIALELIDLIDSRLLMTRGHWRDAAARLEQIRIALAKFEDEASRQLGMRADLMLGRCYEMLQKPTHQLTALKRVLDIDPSLIVARSGVAAALQATGKVDDASAAYRAMQKDLPSASVEAARLAIEATLAAPPDQRRWAAAEKALDEAIARVPDSRDIPFLAAEIEVGKGQYARARERLEAAKQRWPDDPAPWIGQALASAEGARVEPGLDVLADAKRKFGDLLEFRSAAAGLLARSQQPGAGAKIAALADGIEALPEDRRIQFAGTLIRAHRQAGDRAGARKLLNRLSQLHGDDLNIRAVQFELAQEEGDAAGSAEASREIRRIEGEGGMTWRYVESLRLMTAMRAGPIEAGDPARVAAYLKEISIQRPDMPQLPLLEAELADITGDRGRAVELCRRAIEMGLVEPRLVGLLAQLLATQGHDQEAARALEYLPRSTPLVGLPGQVAAELARKAGNLERARKLAREAVPPDSTTAGEQTWLGSLLRSTQAPATEVESAYRRGAELAAADAAPWLALIDFLVGAGRLADAERALNDARSRLPAEAGAIAAALGYELLAKRGLAEEAFREALSARPRSHVVALEAADFYLRGGRADRAEPLLRELLADRDRPLPAGEANRARRGLITCLGTRGDARNHDEAMALVDAILRTAANPSEGRRLRAFVLAGHPGRRREAIEALEAGTADRTAAFDEQLLLFRLYDLVGDWPRAEVAARPLLERDPVAPAFLGAYATTLIRRGQVDASRPIVDRLTRVDPTGLPTTALRARLLASEGRGGEAADLLVKAARADRGSAETISLVLEEIGQLAAAEATFRQVADARATPESGLPLIAFLGRTGRTQAAVELLGVAWKACPPSTVARVGLDVLRASDRRDLDPIRRFRVQLREAIAASPSDAALTEALAFADLLAGDAEAESSYRRMVANDPKDAASLNNLAWMLCFRAGREAEALDLAERAVQVGGPVPELLDTRAVAALSAGRAEPAIRDLEAAIAARPDPAIYFHLARAYDLAGRAQDARSALRQAGPSKLEKGGLDPAEREQYDRLVGRLGRGL